MIAKPTPDNGPIVGMIESMLDKIAEIENERERIITNHPLEARRDALLAEAAKISDQLAEIVMPLDTQIAGLKAAVIEATLKVGGSVKGSAFMAVYTKGRTTWDGKLLEGFTLAHPELEKARRIGEPSVSIKPVKRGGDAATM